MQTPRIFLSYSPRGPGLRAAVVYLPAGRDIRGWFTGPGPNGLESAYFVLEDYYSPREARCVLVRDEALHSRWTDDEAMCHELSTLQNAFVNEWLFYPGETGAAVQLAAYAHDELATGEANVRHERLGRFSRDQPNWTYYSPEFEDGVLGALSRKWPLDLRMGAAATA